jgi:hypothetical protein
MAFLSLRSRTILDAVKPGESFRRREDTHLVETATVLGLREDLLGIPHVLFKIAIACSDSNRFEEGSRILALRSFLDAYPERIQ